MLVAEFRIPKEDAKALAVGKPYAKYDFGLGFGLGWWDMTPAASW